MYGWLLRSMASHLLILGVGIRLTHSPGKEEEEEEVVAVVVVVLERAA